MQKESISYENIIQNKVAGFIKENDLLNKKNPVIIGFSGGADSSALLDILICLGYKCIVAHCNFQLRGEESYRDSAFSKLRAKQYGITYCETIFNTKEYAAKNKLSIEMAARDLRYDWFNELIQKYSAQSIAVAHHMDDTVETFFLNLFRGTGISGLSGINTINGNVIRPLNCLTREEILKYLKVKEIEFVTDSSNYKDIYTRNKIRLDLIPLIKEINPNATDAIIKTIANLKDTEIVYKDAIKNIKNNIVFKDGECYKISIQLLKETIAPKTVLFEILKEFGINASNLDDIYNSLNGISGKHFYLGNYILVKDREHLLINHRSDVVADNQDFYIEENVKKISAPIDISFENIKYFHGINLPKNKNIGCFDLSKLVFPLILRKWKRGDKFVPLGMTGMKKLSDFFSDNKFSLVDKKNTWVLCSGENIIWIVGERIDNRFKVTPFTSDILMVSI